MDNHKPRILIVDDEPVMRTITESVLAQHEFEISTADSAEQAILMINEGFVPDLLLLDVLMPGMNGFEACRILRRKHRLEHLPIIMLTALDDQISIDEAYRCGATDFITKPLNIPLMPHRIRYLLRSAMAASAADWSAGICQTWTRSARASLLSMPLHHTGVDEA